MPPRKSRRIFSWIAGEVIVTHCSEVYLLEVIITS